MEILYTFLPHKWQWPSKDIHEVGKPIWMLHRIELSDVHHIVLIFQHSSCNQWIRATITFLYTTKPVRGSGRSIGRASYGVLFFRELCFWPPRLHVHLDFILGEEFMWSWRAYVKHKLIDYRGWEGGVKKIFRKRLCGFQTIPYIFISSSPTLCHHITQSPHVHQHYVHDHRLIIISSFYLHNHIITVTFNHRIITKNTTITTHTTHSTHLQLPLFPYTSR